MLSSIELGAVLAPAISAVGVLILYHYLGREYLGADESKQWNTVRRGILGTFDSYVRDNSAFALTNLARPKELVRTVEKSSQEVAVLFDQAGYLQGIISGLKTRGEGENNQYEAGSMVYRESKSDLIPDALALYQTHVFWFENEDGTCDIYAHHEYSSLNPLVAWKHYRAVGQDATRGKEEVSPILE